MQRSTLLALAMSCAITCTGYSQQPSSQPTPPPPAAGANGQSATTPLRGRRQRAKPTTPPRRASRKRAHERARAHFEGRLPAKSAVRRPGCVSSLTREQFEQLTNALQPADKGPVPPEVKRKFAAQYAKLLTLADAARQLGLENDPKVQQIFAFARNQILAEALNQHYMEEYAHPTDQQIQEYYDQNSKKYLEATLLRIIIPKAQAYVRQAEARSRPTQRPMRRRSGSAGSPAKIRPSWRRRPWKHAGIKTPPPDVNVGARRPGSLPEAHEAVFEFEAGRDFASCSTILPLFTFTRWFRCARFR